MALATDMGFAPVDAGPLFNCRGKKPTQNPGKKETYSILTSGK